MGGHPLRQGELKVEEELKQWTRTRWMRENGIGAGVTLHDQSYQQELQDTRHRTFSQRELMFARAGP